MTFPAHRGPQKFLCPRDRFTRTAVAWKIANSAMDNMIEFATIFVLAILQSIFGIGILFFGTPTLLLLGFPFSETLSILLPASAAVSLFQVIRGNLPDRRQIGNYIGWCLVPLTAALVGSLSFGWDAELESIVAVTLLLYVVVRLSRRTERALQLSATRLPQAWLAVIGTVHGFSNLGGGLLAIFAASSFSDKKQVRSNIAFCYLCFAVIQLVTLAILKPEFMHLTQFGYAALAIIVFIVIDRQVFGAIATPVFDRILTLLIGCYSVLIFLKLFGVFQAPAPT